MEFSESLVKSWKFRWFLFLKLPMAFLSGVRVVDVSDKKCSVQIKYKWLTQNPFHSMYFACQLMAAELSTGVLVLREIQKTGKAFSMLVTRVDSSYSKKAIGKISFQCSDAEICANAIQKAMDQGQGQECTMKSIGIDANGDEVSRVFISWSLKVRSNNSLPTSSTPNT